jgi:hypothetical protein
MAQMIYRSIFNDKQDSFHYQNKTLFPKKEIFAVIISRERLCLMPSETILLVLCLIK